MRSTRGKQHRYRANEETKEGSDNSFRKVEQVEPVGCKSFFCFSMGLMKLPQQAQQVFPFYCHVEVIA